MAAIIAAVRKMPPGQPATVVFKELVAQGLMDGTTLGKDGTAKDYNVFNVTIRYAIKTGKLDEGHVLFNGKSAGPEARRQRIREIVKAAGKISVRGIGYVLLSEGIIKNMMSDLKLVTADTVAMRETDLELADAIVDETTRYESFLGYADLDDNLDAFGVYLDPWRNQPVRLEIWSEKGTVLGALEDTLEELRINALAIRGHIHFGTAHRQAREMVERASRAASATKRGQRVHVLYLGDFDPSGLSIVDLDGSGVVRYRMRERLTALGADPKLFSIERIALTRAHLDGIRNLGIPVKETTSEKRGDPNAPGYVKTHGRTCWELDALPSTTLRQTIRDIVLGQRNERAWNRALAEERDLQERVGRRVQKMRADFV
jgi:hypothetical protein